MDALMSLFGRANIAQQPGAATGAAQGPALGGLLGCAPGTKPKDNIDPRSKSPLYEMFNQRLSDLLEALCGAVPENETLKAAYNIHKSLSTLLPGEPLRRWLEAIEGFSEVLLERTPENEAMFIAMAPKLEYIKELEITNYWDQLADEAKDNLWDHLRQLDSMAQALGQFKPELLTKMQSMAELYATDLPDNMSLTAMGSKVLNNIIEDESVLKMIGVDPSYAKQPGVAQMAQQMLGTLGNFGFE